MSFIHYSYLFLGDDFNFPKAHGPEHYVWLIQQFGTTDNYNTEFTERLHIDFIKDAWRASNRKEVIFQMMDWLSRRERVINFESRFLWLQGRIKRKYTKAPTGSTHVSVSKRPSARNVSVDTIAQTHRAPDFTDALKTFVAQHRDLSDRPRRYTRRVARHVSLPVRHVDVWYQAKFTTPNVQLNNAPGITETARATPPRSRRRRQGLSNARFDTVFVNANGAEETGIEGMLGSS